MVGSEEYPDEWDNFSRHAVVTPSRKHRSAGTARATQQHFVKKLSYSTLWLCNWNPVYSTLWAQLDREPVSKSARAIKRNHGLDSRISSGGGHPGPS